MPTNPLWLSAERAVRLVNALLVTIVVARHLGVAEYGIYAQSVAWAAFAAPFSTLGLDRVVIGRYVKATASGRRVLPFIGTLLYLRLISTTIASILIFLLASVVSGAEVGCIALIASAANVFQVGDVMEHRLVASGRLRSLAPLRVALGAVALGARMVLVLCDASLYWFAAAFILDSMMASFVLIGFHRHHEGRELVSALSVRLRRMYATRILRVAAPYAINLLVHVFYLRIATILTGRILGGESAGLFSIATRLYEGVLPLAAAASAAIYPKLVAASGDKIKMQAILVFQFRRLMVGGVLVMIVYQIFAWRGFPLVIGGDYGKSAMILAIMALAAPLHFTLNLRANYLTLVNKSNAILKITILSAIFSFMIMWAMIACAGLHGAAWGYVMCVIFNSVGVNIFMPELKEYNRMLWRRYGQV